MKTARDRVREALARTDEPFSSLTALSVASGVPLATTSRIVRDLAGKGRVHSKRKGKGSFAPLQIMKTVNGGLHRTYPN